MKDIGKQIIEQRLKEEGLTEEQLVEKGIKYTYENNMITISPVNPFRKSLFKEVSEMMQEKLKLKNIENSTSSEFCLIRNKILKDLKQIEIYEGKYNYLKDYFLVVGWVEHCVEEFYK